MMHFKASTINLGGGFKLFFTAKQKGNDSYFDLAFFFFKRVAKKMPTTFGPPKDEK